MSQADYVDLAQQTSAFEQVIAWSSGGLRMTDGNQSDSVVRRDTGESYQDFLTKLAHASGIETSTRADLTRTDRKRKKKGSRL